jgi:two-component system sensor histidine kinase CiaH
MKDAAKTKIKRVTFIYWLLLTYIVAALVWWFISLTEHIREKRDLKLAELNSTIKDPAFSQAFYNNEKSRIYAEYSRSRAKYVGEGSVFLILILIGAAFVYRSVRRELKLQRQQQNFMMAVTHELKTPVSVARLNLETLRKYSLDAGKQEKLIRNTLDELSRLNTLTNNILVSAQLEEGRNKALKEELDLSLLLNDCIQDFRTRFPDRLIEEQVEPDVDLKGDPLLLQMLINNLLENAIKYSPKEGKMTASLKKNGDTVVLTISDEGPGIPDAEKKKIFSKFYRIGNEATRKKQGTGLGLYLCSKVAADHNADISVTNNTSGGSTFEVAFHI